MPFTVSQRVVMTLPGKGTGSEAVQRVSGDNDLVAWQGFQQNR